MAGSAQEESVVTTSSGGDKYFKYAVIGLFVIAAIVLAEGAYLYLNQREPSSPLQDEVSEVREVVLSSPSPTPHPFSARTRSSIDISEVETFAENLKIYNPPNFFVNASINWTAAGRVQETNTNQSVEVIGAEDASSLSILNDQGERMTVYLNARERNSARFILKGSSTSSNNIGFSDIRPGDYVTIKATLNLLDSSHDGILVFEIERDTSPGSPN